MAGRNRDRGTRAEDYDRYGMENEDWRHLDDYWRSTYGNQYPRENEQNRWVGGSAGAGLRNHERTDAHILEDVTEQLKRHPGIDAANINVAVTRGEVVLHGTVERKEVKKMAEEVAESVSGVKNVRNELRIQQQQWQPGGGDRAA